MHKDSDVTNVAQKLVYTTTNSLKFSQIFETIQINLGLGLEDHISHLVDSLKITVYCVADLLHLSV